MNATTARAGLADAPERPEYVAQTAQFPSSFKPDWQDSFWTPASTLEVKHFRPESSSHRPRTAARLLHDAKGIHGIFQVQDQYVRCVRTRYLDEVWKDSCVEFFAQPKPGGSYFNFEFNCGGTFLCSHIVNPERTANGFKEFTRVPGEIGRTIQVRSSLPRAIEQEIQHPLVWTLRFFVPWTLFERYLGLLGEIRGQVWSGNFFKCAEDVSHPHWASWSPVDEFNFHLPHCFGSIRFA